MLGKPSVGMLVMYGGKEHVILHVQAMLTPFKKINQTTKLEGYTLGLARIKGCRKED